MEAWKLFISALQGLFKMSVLFKRTSIEGKVYDSMRFWFMILCMVYMFNLQFSFFQRLFGSWRQLACIYVCIYVYVYVYVKKNFLKRKKLSKKLSASAFINLFT